MFAHLTTFKVNMIENYFQQNNISMTSHRLSQVPPPAVFYHFMVVEDDYQNQLHDSTPTGHPMSPPPPLLVVGNHHSAAATDSLSLPLGNWLPNNDSASHNRKDIVLYDLGYFSVSLVAVHIGSKHYKNQEKGDMIS
ncbi:hypothetical protein L1987_44872 [Smallanthus sonchifolius]|uniref:Uncharacterized protein n=1 Tax=Smallanthus sonchifolius TaxID=185202 RepID=A0ACB9GQS2_9ASTR|nr:hypothetical protein L1987_44872 [Smallanthus sonchifolius]